MMMVQVEGLRKQFGAVMAVDDLSFAVDKGQMVAVVGPDGAGKTSTFRAICGLLAFDAGCVSLAGYEIPRELDRIKPILGYMPQHFSLYPDLTVEENLFFYAGLFGLTRQEFDLKKGSFYRFSSLDNFRDRRAGALSGGMKQKLALSCTLIHDPQILILDEPTGGVDPLARQQFWEVLRQLRDSGTTILISTPYMDEAELCDRVIFLYQGRKLAEGTPAQLVASFRKRLYRAAVRPSNEIMTKLSKIDNLVCRRFGSVLHLYTIDDRPLEEFASQLEELGIPMKMITPIPPQLEDVFVDLIEG